MNLESPKTLNLPIGTKIMQILNGLSLIVMVVLLLPDTLLNIRYVSQMLKIYRL